MRAGEITVNLPGQHTYVVKYTGMIEMYRNRISIIEEKTKEESDYPSEWCSIKWAKKEEKPIDWRECIEIGCHRGANLETGYCGSHSLYGTY